MGFGKMKLILAETPVGQGCTTDCFKETIWPYCGLVLWLSIVTIILKQFHKVLMES
jgi:hypothetical protein